MHDKDRGKYVIAGVSEAISHNVTRRLLRRSSPRNDVLCRPSLWRAQLKLRPYGFIFMENIKIRRTEVREIDEMTQHPWAG